MSKRKISRRQFLGDTAKSAAVIGLTPGLLLGCQTGSTNSGLSADAMDEALEAMVNLAPLTNHGPMAAEALVSLGHPEKVMGFVESYKRRFNAAYPNKIEPVTEKNWSAALGDGNRVADWTNFFRRELSENDWRPVLEKWANILAPGLAAAAAHGLLRTSHAVRSLSVKESALRKGELAEGLGYWAAYYQTLPEASNDRVEKMSPTEAIRQIPLLPDEKRTQNGSIMLSLQKIKDFSPFSKTIDLIDLNHRPEELITELTETFAGIYAKNVTPRNFITLIHAVTGTTCLRSLVPYLSAPTMRKMLRYGWQMAAGLYSISGRASVGDLSSPKDIKKEDLVDRAVASKEEHAIKFTEACLREHALNPKPIYLQAANDAIGRLQSF